MEKFNSKNSSVSGSEPGVLNDEKARFAPDEKARFALWIRWAHWINFPVLTMMVVSGLYIYWANDAYTPWVPAKIYDFFGLDHKLSVGMYLHFALGWIFTINGVLYVAYVIVSGEWREMIPRASSFRDAAFVFLHDLGLRRELPPQGKLNAAQRIAYTGIILVAVVAVASGFAIYKPAQLWWLTSVFGGYEGARLVHFISMISFCLFFVVHIAQVIRAGWTNFKSMVAKNEHAPSRRSFIVLGAGYLGGALGFWWLTARPQEGSVPWPFRRMLALNSDLWSLSKSDDAVNPAAPLPGAPARINSDIGLDDEVENWSLQVGSDVVTIEQLKELPPVECTEVFKCVEGWSQIISYRGIRFSDFANKFAGASLNLKYVGLETPDGEYYVSIDMASMLHPKTLLAYEMNGVALSEEHGAPLRLIIPVKYGIKNLKRVGRIFFSNERPRDYWTERGYDWYAGL